MAGFVHALAMELTQQQRAFGDPDVALLELWIQLDGLLGVANRGPVVAEHHVGGRPVSVVGRNVRAEVDRFRIRVERRIVPFDLVQFIASVLLLLGETAKQGKEKT